MTGMTQLTLNDIYPDCVPPPPVWECMKTCVNFKVFEPDNFPMGGARCTYGRHMDGTSGRDWYEKIVDNVCVFYCKYYKREVEDGENTSDS